LARPQPEARADSLAGGAGPEKVPGGTFFGSVPDEKLTRRYYIAAEPVVWNYIPLRKDPICSTTGAVQQML